MERIFLTFFATRKKMEQIDLQLTKREKNLGFKKKKYEDID
jgi:hypothetical protein